MPAPLGVARATRTRVMTMNTRIRAAERRPQPANDAEPSVRESSLLGGRRAAAKTASQASLAKTCVIPPERGFRRCLVASIVLLTGTVLTAGQAPAPPTPQPPTFKVRVD